VRAHAAEQSLRLLLSLRLLQYRVDLSHSPSGIDKAADAIGISTKVRPVASSPRSLG